LGQNVKTAVLESTDGLDFDDEKRVDSEELNAFTKEAERRANSKPLWEQLQEQRDKQQAEYDANTKLIYAPPKALDDEEYEHLERVYRDKEDARARLKQAEEEEISKFASLQKILPVKKLEEHNDEESEQIKNDKNTAKNENSNSTSMTNVVIRKRKLIENHDDHQKKKHSKKEKKSKNHKKKKNKRQSNEDRNGSLLVQYSDSDSD